MCVCTQATQCYTVNFCVLKWKAWINALCRNSFMYIPLMLQVGLHSAWTHDPNSRGQPRHPGKGYHVPILYRVPWPPARWLSHEGAWSDVLGTEGLRWQYHVVLEKVSDRWLHGCCHISETTQRTTVLEQLEFLSIITCLLLITGKVTPCDYEFWYGRYARGND